MLLIVAEFLDCCGSFWIIFYSFLGTCGLLRMFLDCCGFLWVLGGRCELSWIEFGCCGLLGRFFGSLWVVVDFFGLLCVTADNCEFFLFVVGRCWWFLVLVSPHVLSVWMYQICLICPWCMQNMCMKLKLHHMQFYVCYFLKFLLRPIWVLISNILRVLITIFQIGA